MISRILYALQRALFYIKEHPQLLFVLILILVVPFIFLYNAQQFLEVGRDNQDRLQKDRVGIMHDVFVSLMKATDYDPAFLQTEIDTLSALNPDIGAFRIVKQTQEGFISIAALDTELVGELEPAQELYERSLLNTGGSFLYPTSDDKGRIWLVYRAIPVLGEPTYFIFTQFSLASVDASFAKKERGTWYSLIYIYMFLLALAYWHIRLTDYKYLYSKARKANEMKDLFTNMIAHELRAPLTAIRGYASMTLESTGETEHKKYATRIKDSSERLLEIINDLLDVARIQSGKLSVEKEEFDASAVVIAVTDELLISAKEKGIQLSHTGTIETRHVQGDRKRLHQALTNLVSNAIKYTQEGSIEITIEEKVAVVEIRVKDTGMGISSEDQKKLFAPFFRVQSADVSQITGTGLGMWITKELIELMGAKVAVESIKGVGTHVVVRLPKQIKDQGKWSST